MTDYRRAPEAGVGLRLHLNENTAGCSPRVVEAVHRLTARQVAMYPDYQAMHEACARALGVTGDRLLLTNGLDEGILAACVAAVATAGHGPRPESIIVEPAFDMYRAMTEACGGRICVVPPVADFEFPLDEVLARITPATAIVFLTNPNNPTGRPIAREGIRAIAGRAGGALVFLDEAYNDFSGDSFVDELPHFTNVVIGRTFSKAYGLAGLRIGALLGDPGRLAPLARVVPPYSVNAVAAAALGAALDDREYVQWYLGEVEESKRLIHEACRRLDLHSWPSAANFVLVRVGARATALVAELAGRGMHVRDRSGERGCTGCIRISAGTVADTAACLAAMEEILCAAQS